MASAHWEPLTAGGFSGAQIFRGSTGFALKRWPGRFDPNRLRWIHARMEEARLPFVPEVVADRFGETVVAFAGHLWDVTTWMPGAATFHTEPTEAKLRAACVAVATVHLSWATRPSVERSSPVPAVNRRLQLLADWRAADGPTTDPLLAEARDFVRKSLDVAETQLRRWEFVALPLQPCLCDVWHDHLLYTGDALSGLIDFGAVKVDTPAVDLARLLGDLVGSEHPWFEQGLTAYADADPPAAVPADLVRLLAETADLCGVANWLLRWPSLGPGAGRERAAARLRQLLGRQTNVRGKATLWCKGQIAYLE